MIDRTHPAVEAANKAVKRAYGSRGGEALKYHTTALRAAVPHLTADDLHDTPAGRALMAEAWEEGAMAHAEATSYMTPGTRHVINEMMRAANPYKETPNE